MKLSIRRTVLIATLLPVLALSAIVAVYLVRWLLDDAQVQMETTAKHSMDYLAEASRFSLLVGDKRALTSLAEGSIGAAQDAVAVIFLEADGRRIAAIGDADEVAILGACQPEPTACRATHNRHVASRRITALNVEPVEGLELADVDSETPAGELASIGSILMAFDLQRLQEQQRGRLFNGAVMMAIAALIGMLLASILSRRLTGPIRGLSTVVAQIQEGQLDARTRPTGSGELRELEDGVNRMAQQVEEANVLLQTRVQEATAELSRTLSDLEQRNQDIDAARRRAEQANLAKDLFLARMSHELRTPLSSVVGYAKLLRDEDSPARRTQFADLVDRGAALLTATIDDILNFVKLQSDSLQLEQREFDLPACLESVVILHGPVAHAKNLELDCMLDNDLPLRVRGDSVRLSQILNNLLSNAVKFTSCGWVQVRASAGPVEDGRCNLELIVSDSGIGIADVDLEQLFEPFTQADESTTRRFGGTGLGLSITRRLARLMDGDIDLRGRDGEGSEAKARVVLDVVQTAPAVQAMATSGIDLLVLDGTDACAEGLAYYLADWHPQLRHLEFEVGMASIEARSPDLVVLADCISGPAQVDQIRSRFQGPLLLLVRESEPGRTLFVRPSPDIPMLTRPVRRETLQNTVRDLLAGRWPVSADRPDVLARRFRCTVLVAEDNELNRRLVTDQLRRFGAQVIAVADAPEAIAAISDGFFDLVLMDVHMPGMTGVQLAEEIREQVPALPVYALTANVIGTEEAQLSRAGVRGILFKPLREAQLVGLLESHADELSLSAAEPAAEYRLGEPVVDAETANGELHRLMSAITASSANGDALNARRAAHDMLGIVRMAGLDELLAPIAALELAIAENRSENLPELLSQMASRLGRT